MNKETSGRPRRQKAGKNPKRDEDAAPERKRRRTKAEMEMHRVEVDQNKAVDEEGKRKRNEELLALQKSLQAANNNEMDAILNNRTDKGKGKGWMTISGESIQHSNTTCWYLFFFTANKGLSSKCN